MKITALFLLLLTLALSANAKTDTATYVIKMNKGALLRGKIVSMKKGISLTLVTEDGAQKAIDWGKFRDYMSISEQQKLREKHKKWQRCTVVVFPDTFLVRMEPKQTKWYERYQLSRWGESDEEELAPDDYTDYNIVIAYDDEFERKLSPGNYTALVLNKNGQELKYLSINDENGENAVYRVMVDGKCQLLLCEVKKIYIDQTMGNNRKRTGSEPIYTYTNIIDKYFIYYRGYLSKMKIESDRGINIITGFKQRCKVEFSECPVLVSKINDGKLKQGDLPQIVKEFNQCIGGK